MPWSSTDSSNCRWRVRSADPTPAPTNPTFSRKRDTALSAPVAAPHKGHNVAIEGDVESHLHPTPSWEIADHPMPTGREEIWRFTPIKTFTPVLSEVALESSQEANAIDVDVQGADGITITELATSELKGLAETPLKASLPPH